MEDNLLISLETCQMVSKLYNGYQQRGKITLFLSGLQMHKISVIKTSFPWNNMQIK